MGEVIIATERDIVLCLNAVVSLMIIDKAHKGISLVLRGISNPRAIPGFIKQHGRSALTSYLAEIISRGYIPYKQSGDFYSYAADHGQVYSYSTRREYEFSPAPHDAPQVVSDAAGKHSFDQPFVAELHECRLYGPRPIIQLPDGDFLLDSAAGRVNMLGRGISHALCEGTIPLGRSPSTNILAAGLLTGPLARYYPHWFMDYLPRLAGIEQYMSETGEEIPILIPQSPPDWMVDSLEVLGYNESDLIQWDETAVTIDSLIIPSIWQERENLSSDSTTSLIRIGYDYSYQIRSAIDAENDPTDLPERIFIRRIDAGNRRVANWDEIEPILSEYDIEPVEFERRPWRSQVKMFANAETVIRVHGGGLTNLLFTDPGTDVLEIFGELATPDYYAISNILDLQYHCMNAKQVGPDVEISPEILERKLDKIAT